jgi:hypothetical protein
VVLWYNRGIENKFSLDKLVENLRKKGGHVNKYYLQEWNKNKHAVVFLNGWFSGKNIREAITKALA